MESHIFFRVLVLLQGLLIVANVSAESLYAFPRDGQSLEQQERDEFQCYKWAKQKTGFDPVNALPTTVVTTSDP